MIILLAAVIVILLLVLNGYRNMRNVKSLPEEEFKKDLRRVQLIDLREKEKYEHRRRMGERNRPIMNSSMKMSSVRKEQAIYLYDHNGRLPIRAGKMLKKKGYSDIYMLKNGISKWTGKIKS